MRRMWFFGGLLAAGLVLLAGCMASNQAPTASFTATPTSGEAPLTVVFDASGSSDPDGTIVSYTWSFGDGENGAGVSGYHVYNSPGTYTTILTVVDDAGAAATTSQVITVTAPENQAPSAGFTATPDSGPAPLTVMFNAAASTDPDGTIASYDWDFGDGSPNGSGIALTHTYTAAGTYVVVLTVTDDDGADATATGTVEVTAPGNQVPTASFTTDPPLNSLFAHPPVTVDFDASGSFDPDGTIVSYTWNFGDGNAGTGKTVSHTYNDSGKFSIILTVVDDDGVAASATKTITILNLPTEPYVPYIPPLQPPFNPPQI